MAEEDKAAEQAKKAEEALKKLQREQKRLINKSVSNPRGLVTTAKVQNVSTNANQTIDPNTGQVVGDANYEASQVTDPQQAATVDPQEAATFESVKVQPQVEENLDNLEAAQGTLSSNSTVQGQMAKLMSQFEGGEVPPWAAGAIRNANAQMQARGLGASSMAGAAITQAAMESALPIASQDANIFAQLDFKNLDNLQQTALYKSQQSIAAMFSDQAAENVERQINATSKNQVTQFYASLHSQVEQFNAAQINAVKQFNAGEENASKKFNAELKAQREQFNAQNSLFIAQANAKWRQDVATLDATAQNNANMEAAKAANGITQSTLDAIWQRERDILAFAFQQSESQLDRDLKIFLADKNIDALKDQQNSQEEADNRRGLGQIVGTIIGGLF